VLQLCSPRLRALAGRAAALFPWNICRNTQLRSWPQARACM